MRRIKRETGTQGASVEPVAAGGRDVKTRIKKLILKNPDVSAEEIITALSKKGDVPSKFTVAGIRSDFRHSLRLLKREGFIDIDI